MPQHVASTGSSAGGFLEGLTGGFQTGVRIRRQRRFDQLNEEEILRRRVAEELRGEQDAERAAREEGRFDIELFDAGLARGDAPADPTRVTPAGLPSGLIENVDRIRRSTGAELVRGFDPSDAPQGFHRTRPTRETSSARFGVTSTGALTMTGGTEEEAVGFNLAHPHPEEADPTSPFQLKFNESGEAFLWNSRTGKFEPATLPGGEQFRGSTSGGATAEAFVRRGEGIIAQTQSVLSRFGEDADEKADAALQQGMGVNLIDFRRIQSEFYSGLLGDAPADVGTRLTTIPQGLQSQIAENIARGGSTSAPGRSIGLGNRDLAAGEIPPDTALPSDQSIKETISSDQADFLRSRGMSEADLAARYNIVR